MTIKTTNTSRNSTTRCFATETFGQTMQIKLTLGTLTKESCPKYIRNNTRLCLEQGHTVSPTINVVYFPHIDVKSAVPVTMVTSLKMQKYNHQSIFRISGDHNFIGLQWKQSLHTQWYSLPYEMCRVSGNVNGKYWIGRSAWVNIWWSLQILKWTEIFTECTGFSNSDRKFVAHCFQWK